MSKVRREGNREWSSGVPGTREQTGPSVSMQGPRSTEARPRTGGKGLGRGPGAGGVRMVSEDNGMAIRGPSVG